MLKISTIQINHLENDCVTDIRPVISFALVSDHEKESMDYAEISCGDWKTTTTSQTSNVYGGQMSPFTSYTIHIKAVGCSGETAEGEAVFTTGRLDTKWKAKWISDGDYKWPKKESPVPMVFRKKLSLQGEIKRAWMNSSALGIYEFEIDGQKVGKDYFAPGFTSYLHQIQYQTYEITGQLKTDSMLQATVAGGWAVGSFNYSRNSRIAADHPSLLCEIYVEYIDGRKEQICTDETWKVTEDGPVRMAQWYDGETYDATVSLEQANWRCSQIVSQRGNPALLAQYGQSVRACQTMIPISHSKAPSGEYIYDFGQNFAGVICLKLRGHQGQQIICRHAEVLSEGELFVNSLRTAKVTVTYTCREGEQFYSPHFTYMGFRYVGVRGIEPEDLELTAIVLHSELREIGTFSCSNPLLNKLNENIKWSGYSNFVDIPTDCPQRDERLGWTGDIAIFASTASYNFDMSRFFAKWLRDVSAEQGIGGGLPMVIPKNGDAFPKFATSCWGDCCILVPWAEYLARGDKTLLEVQYPTMKRFLKAAKRWSSFLSLGPNSRYVWKYPFHFGDWCAPDEVTKQWTAKGQWIATAYFANSCDIVAQIADILGNQKDAQYYRNLRKKIIKAYREIFTDGNGKLTNEFQTAYVLPLHFKMTEGEETSVMATNLKRLVEKAGNKLTTGFSGTPYLLFALSDYGHIDTAYNLLLQEKSPSWLYEVKAGATTIWERWDAMHPDGTVNGDGMVSFNHYAYGAVGDWMYRRVAGIEPLEGGYKKFRIAPMPGGGLTWAKGSIDTSYGVVSSEWEMKKGQFTIKMQVPVSTTCMLVLPNGKSYELASGSYIISQ